MKSNYSTYHSIERTRERRKLKNRRAAANHIYHAVRQGKRAEDFTSWERSYLEPLGGQQASEQPPVPHRLRPCIATKTESMHREVQ